MTHTRVTESDVEDLLDTDVSLSVISAYLPAAKRFVTDNLEGLSIADDTLTEIEKHLAAGIVASERDPTAASVSLGDASITYQRDGELNEHFRVAQMLDPTGTVASALKPRKGLKWKAGTFD